MKCGTSTLAAQLGAQDGIFMTDPKEPNYFSDDRVFANGASWYADLFAPAAASDLKGEASTHYTKRPDLPDTLPRMRAMLPDLRLVYMIRDPMVRLVSHYLHLFSEGQVSNPLDRVIDDSSALIDYGLYGYQVAPYVEAYGKEAILLTSLERIGADPQAELARIARHIGFEGEARWCDDLGAQNVSASRVRKLPMHRLLVENEVATFLRRTLVPKTLRTWIRDARKIKGRPEVPEEVRPRLEARFLEDREELAKIFPGDPSLTLAYPFCR